MTGCLHLAAAVMPERMARLPVARGFPVPWFVDKVDGQYDHRVMDGRKLERAVLDRLCWVCGVPLGRYAAFVVGPMCLVNRTSAEPPSHVDCADYSARACPFLSRPDAVRREGGLPPAEQRKCAGEMIRRNPGVTLVWGVTKWSVFGDGRGGVLHSLGESPTFVRWYREGRPATRAEVEESIDSGIGILEAEAAKQAGGLQALERARKAAERHLPAA